MTNGKHYDMLQSLSLLNPDGEVYATIERIVELLEERTPSTKREVFDQISDLLTDAESAKMLKLICLKLNIDETQLLKDCNAATGSHIAPKLLLHILLFSVPYVCAKLQADETTVAQLIDQLKKSFTVDTPLSWLKSFLSLTEQERNFQAKQKNKLMQSGYAVGQALDTAEERRVKQRNTLKDKFKRFFRGLTL